MRGGGSGGPPGGKGGMGDGPDKRMELPSGKNPDPVDVNGVIVLADS